MQDRSRFLLGLCLTLLVACSSAEKSRRAAEQALSLGEYAEAAAQYQRAYQQSPVKQKAIRADLALKMGEAYALHGNQAKALASFRTAVRLKSTDSLLYRRLGMAHLQMGHYVEAQKALSQYLNSVHHLTDTLAKSALLSAQTAAEIVARGSLYVVKSATQFNSNRSDFSPMLWGEGKEQLLFFSSMRNAAQGEEISGITAQKKSDIFWVRKDEKGQWKSVEALPAPVNSIADEATPAFSPDGKTMYFTHCPTHPDYPRGAEIWWSVRSDAAWQKPQRLALSRDTLSNFAHPAVAPDGQWIYFSSDMPGGQGGYDLWRASIANGHGVGVVENLGATINTAGDEQFPAFRPNGELYFSSNGRQGLGGLDLYCAQPDSSKGWSVVHLPAPMNSFADDFGMTFEGEHLRGYFSSSRASGGRGWDNIYEFSYPEVLLSVKGWVYEQDAYELPAAVVYIVGDDGTYLKTPVRSDGSFEQALAPGVNYLFLATCQGYLNYTQQLHTANSLDESHEYVLQFPLPPMNISVLVRNVFYDFDSANITTESAQALDRLAALLLQNQHITIELAAHTDQRGQADYNQRLSQRRAESVIKYLVQKGIAAARLTAVGYGKTQPKVVNKRLSETHQFLREGDTLTAAFIARLTPAQQDSCHAMNRRTEFRVLRTTYGLLDNNGNPLIPQIKVGEISAGNAQNKVLEANFGEEKEYLPKEEEEELIYEE